MATDDSFLSKLEKQTVKNHALSISNYIKLENKNIMNNAIDVIYPTHGIQSGAQVQFDPSTHTWTVWNKRGLERTFRTVTSYARYMTKG